MKMIFVIILIFTCEAGAKTLQCEITNSSQSGEVIRIQGKEKVESIDFLKADKSILHLFSETTRAQYEIGSCEVDENKISVDEVDVYSECFLKDHSGKIFFSAKLSSTTEGIVEYVVVPKLEKAYQIRMATDACK
jgi:hypothetical protein